MSSELGPTVYQAILESLPNGVYAVDLNRRILFWNNGAERITGYLRQEVIGRRCQDDLLMHCAADDTILCGDKCPLLATMRDGRQRDSLLYLRTKEGQRIPVHVRAAPIHDADGMVIGAAESFEEASSGEAHVHPEAQAVHSHTDEISGVPDQDSMAAYLDVYLKDYARDGIPFCVLVISIDGFARVREERGARAAEKIFHNVATTVSRNLRTCDKMGRWRTEWFVAILDSCPKQALSNIMALLRRVVSQSAVAWWGDLLSVKISIGSAEVQPEDTVETLIGRAESALIGDQDKSRS